MTKTIQPFAAVVVLVSLLMPFQQRGRTASKLETATVQRELARIAALRAVHTAFERFRSQERQWREWQIELTQIPAPPFGEQDRAKWVEERFRAAGLTDVRTDEIGNVSGVRAGSDPTGQFLVISAHIDTVFPEGTNTKVRREGERLIGPGISDNSAGVTGMIAIADAINHAGVRTSAPLLFVANVGEEGEGDLRGMRHLFAQPQMRERIGSVLVMDGAGTDTIIAEGLGSRRFEVIVDGPGGHSWSDFGMPNPIVILSRVVDRFSQTSLPATPKTTANVGVIRGGTSVNSIPERASMRVDIRSASSGEIDRLERELRKAVAISIEQLAGSNGGQHGVSAEIKVIGDRPAAELPKEARILEVVKAVDAHLQNSARVQRASTDANIPLSLGVEAVALGAGGTGGGAHTLHEWYEPAGRDLALKRILLSVLTLAGAE
jgi:tripeptide aminopeptidase